MGVQIRKEYHQLRVPFSLGATSLFVYSKNEKPVFFGHYWLEADQPSIQRANVCCLDYSVAKEGKLVAYRFDGEKELDERKFCW